MVTEIPFFQPTSHFSSNSRKALGAYVLGGALIGLGIYSVEAYFKNSMLTQVNKAITEMYKPVV